MDRTSYSCVCGQNPSMCYAFIGACANRLRMEELFHKPEDQWNLIQLDVHDLVKSVKDFDDVFWALQYMGTVGVRSRPLSPIGDEIPGSEWTGRFKIKGIRRIPRTKMDQVKSYIREKGPVLATIRINLDFYSDSVAMPYERDRSSPSNGLHNVCLVGYDDGKGIWQFQNSFGTKWGDEGFGKIRYNRVVQYVVPIFINEEILDTYENVQLPNDPAPPPVASTSSSSSCEHQTRTSLSVVDDQFVPKVGMTFTTLEDAGKFYRNYAKVAGFSTRVRSINRKENEIKNQLITCSREGK